MSYHDDAQASISSATAKAPGLILTAPENAPYWGPWYLTVYGMLLRDSERAFDQVELDSWETDRDTDQSDVPVFSARNYHTILQYLPLLSDFSSKFQRGADGKMCQVKKLYYVLEEARRAGIRHRLRGDQWTAIHVATSRARAKELIATYIDINAEVRGVVKAHTTKGGPA
ncbi:hypothetical protein DFH06DRAFT_1349002 [Mycena polygramma]|nr:hypothetical protein DFH06DRAFT_1349002 [Mycena polygramma]